MKVIVTGAGSGIGQQIYRDLANGGHQPFGIGIDGPDISCDFEDDVEHLLADKIFQHGPFDALVNNAGTIELASIPAHTPRQLRRVLRVNVEIPYTLMRAFILSGKEWTPPRGGFRVVNMASMAIRNPGRECPGYSASKAALEAMTRAIAKEYAGDHNWVFACVAPGSVAGTDMAQKGMDWLVEKRGMTEMEAVKYVRGLYGRGIAPTEVSKVVQFALFDMPKTMTGTTLWMPAGCGL